MPDEQTANGTISLALAAEYLSQGKPGFMSKPHEMIAAYVDA
jgi:hypothetical protein